MSKHKPKGSKKTTKKKKSHTLPTKATASKLTTTTTELTAKTVRMKPETWARLTEVSRTRKASVGSLIRGAVRTVYRA